MNTEDENKPLKVRPIFNYIGGKSWMREDLRKVFKEMHEAEQLNNVDRYIEPFCGGLGSFISVYDLLLNFGIKKVILNDINKNLINFYQDLYLREEVLLEAYLKIENEFINLIPERAFSLNKTKNKSEMKLLLVEAEKFFKKIKEEYNEDQEIEKEDTINKSSRLLFLQNHCFNGVYRENQKGKYNTPFNWDSKIYNENTIKKKLNELNYILNLFDEVLFTNNDVKDTHLLDSDLVYCDPPYINEKEGENRYSKLGFNKQDQLDLIKKISPFNFIYSNHKNPILLEEFESQTHFKCLDLRRKNIMSSKNETRNEDKIEILVFKTE